jgi:hypothetical protein
MLINDASITGSLIVNASASFQNISVTGSAGITGSLEVTGSLGTTQTISTQILLTPQILTGQLIVPSGFNGMLTGPVSNGGELTIESGSNLVII